MKPPHHRSSFIYRVTAAAPASSRYRRYPRLSDDGQPYFPWLRWNKRAAGNPDAAKPVSVADDRSQPRLSVRILALIAIAAIFAALVATA